MRHLFILFAISGVLLAQSSAERKVALIIGNDQYTYVEHLQTAVSDARSVQAALHDQFGFETELMLNATREQIISALDQYRRDLPERSSLLIYYAGHGYRDADVDKAYWWPVNARADSRANWISADDITTSIRGLRARHVLIVSDSCFSGTLTRGVATPVGDLRNDRARTLAKLHDRTSRELLASGGNEPVADGGGGGHSVFANAFLRALQRMDRPEFAVEELFQEVRVSVAGQSAQLPQLDQVRNSGDDGGSFVFARIGNTSRPPADTPATAPTETRGNQAASSSPLSAGSIAPGTKRDNPTDGLTYVWIPPGSFMMGCSPGDNECDDSEKPAHRVTITKGFWLGQTAVTQAAYQRVTGKIPSIAFEGENRPVEGVTWDEAVGYCRAIGGRLPTEAEWEYAARAGSTVSRYGNLDEVAWYLGNSGHQTHEVSQKQPNAWGLYDMLGNVFQWVADGYGPYSGAEQTDPQGLSSNTNRVLRGGAWVAAPRNIRASGRGGNEPDNRNGITGFRCAGE